MISLKNSWFQAEFKALKDIQGDWIQNYKSFNLCSVRYTPVHGNQKYSGSPFG